MASDKQIALDLTLKVPPTVGELKAQFKALEEQIEGTRKGTEEYKKALMEMGAVKGELQNLEETIDRLNPQKQGEAIAGLAGSIAGMYAGATAAAELFGVQNEDIEKSILKIQAATAMAQSVQSTFEAVRHAGVLKYVAAQKLADAQAKILTVTNRVLGTSFATVLGPVTLIVAAIVALGVGIYALRDKFEPVSKYVSAFADRIMKLTRVVGNFLGLMDSEEEVQAEKSLNRRIETRKRAIAIAEAEGKDVYELKRRLLLDELHLLEEGSQAYADKLLEVEVHVAARKKKIADEQAKAEEEARKKAEEARKKALAEQRQREAEAYRKFMEQFKGIQDLEAHDEMKRLMDLETKKEQIRLKAFELQMALSAARIAKDEEETARRIANEQAAAAVEEDHFQARITAMQAVGNASIALADLIGRQTAAGKALAIAQAVMNTWVGVTEVLRAKTVLPEPFGTIAKIANVAAIVASGMSAIKNITAVKVPGGGGGAPSMGSAPAAPSIQPVQQNTASTVLNQPRQQDQRVVVVESDIRKTAGRVETIEAAAKVG